MQDKLLSISEAAEFVGVSIDTLRRWDKKGILRSVRAGASGKRYFRQEDLERLTANILTQSEAWVYSTSAQEPPPSYHCATRDIFQSRLERMRIELEKSLSGNDTAILLTAVAGEIGNNSFDHNIGNWIDIAGIFFAYDINKRVVVLSDRGQGILATLRRVKEGIFDDKGALTVAFTEIISGRAPEVRGNGLKFVRSIITRHPLRLEFRTGDAILRLKQDDSALDIVKETKSFHGCLAFIYF